MSASVAQRVLQKVSVCTTVDGNVIFEAIVERVWWLGYRWGCIVWQFIDNGRKELVAVDGFVCDNSRGLTK